MRLDGFRRAVRSLLFDPSSAVCRFEPKFQEVYPLVPEPPLPREEKREAAARLEAAGATCPKLRLNPTGCHGCEHNPLKNGERRRDDELLREHLEEIESIRRLYDVLRLGFQVRPEDVSLSRLELLRAFEEELRAAAETSESTDAETGIRGEMDRHRERRAEPRPGPG